MKQLLFDTSLESESASIVTSGWRFLFRSLHFRSSLFAHCLSLTGFHSRITEIRLYEKNLYIENNNYNNSSFYIINSSHIISTTFWRIHSWSAASSTSKNLQTSFLEKVAAFFGRQFLHFIFEKEVRLLNQYHLLYN
jgi:hypothetical protein